MSDLSKALMRAAGRMRREDAMQVAVGLAMMYLSEELKKIENDHAPQQPSVTRGMSESGIG